MSSTAVLTVPGRPNKPRQKLCREQGILDALFATLRAPFTPGACGGDGVLIGDMDMLESSKWAWVKRMCVLCYHNATLLAFGSIWQSMNDNCEHLGI
jgi:hypothetical protein